MGRTLVKLNPEEVTLDLWVDTNDSSIVAKLSSDSSTGSGGLSPDQFLTEAELSTYISNNFVEISNEDVLKEFEKL